MPENKNTLLYYEILKYQKDNIHLMHDKFNVIELKNPDCDTKRILASIDAVIAPLGFFWGREKIDKAPKLKVIASNTTGHPHIDAAYAQSKDISVITLKNYSQFLKKITPTAELTLGLIITLVRNVIPAFQSVLWGNWDRRPFGGEKMLCNMTLGVAGMGRLGRMVSGYAKGLGMEVRFYDPYVTEKEVCFKRVDSLKELVKPSDVITIHIPHEKETENLFNEDIFSCFKEGSYLINTSRGELIDYNALLDSLVNERLAGAALDVFEGEFSPDFTQTFKAHPLLEYARAHDNLIITPHIGGSTKDAWRMTEEFTLMKVMESLGLK